MKARYSVPHTLVCAYLARVSRKSCTVNTIFRILCNRYEELVKGTFLRGREIGKERKRLMNVGKVYLPRYLVDLNSTFFNLCMSVSQSVSLADAMGYLCSEY